MEIPVHERPRLPALTSVRFFAALWVALFHMGSMKAFTLPSVALRQFASVGYAGVSFFFVLSGFILVYTYLGRTVTKVDFWRARFARLYPALAFALLISAPGFFWCCMQMRSPHPQVVIPEWTWAAQHLRTSIVLSLTLLQSWVPGTALAWNMPNWSLSVEAFFYLLFPFLLPRMARLSRTRLLAVIPIGCLLALSCTLLYVRLQPEGVVTAKTVGPWINTLKYNPMMRLPEFLMGMAAGLLFLRRDGDRRLAWPLVGMGVAGVTAVVVASPWIPYVVIHTAVGAPAFALLIYGMALRPVGLGVLESRLMETLGEASYPFYLLHSFVISSFFINWKTGVVAHQTLIGFATWLLIAVAVAVLVDRLVERPLRRLLRPKWVATTAPLAVAAQV